MLEEAGTHGVSTARAAWDVFLFPCLVTRAHKRFQSGMHAGGLCLNEAHVQPWVIKNPQLEAAVHGFHFQQLHNNLQVLIILKFVSSQRQQAREVHSFDPVTDLANT